MKQILITLLFLSLSYTATAQFGESLKHHVIIAFDEVDPTPLWKQSNEACTTVFDKLLTSEIIRQGDLLSIVGFSTDEKASDLDDYTYILYDPTLGSLSHLPWSNTLKDNLQNRWWDISSQSHRRHKGDKPFSMISLGKMYAFSPLRRTEPSHFTNRTFLVFVSDQRYNGGDFYQEAVSLHEHNYRLTPEMMQDYGQRVASQYFVRHLKGMKLGEHRFIELFEYLPLQKELTLPTVIDYPAGGVKALRGKGGKYHLYITSAARPNPNYQLLQLRYRVADRDNNIILDTICHAPVFDNCDIAIDTFTTLLNLGCWPKAQSVTIDAWVALRDGLYDATVLTPVDSAPDYLAAKGLSVTLPVVYEKKAKVLGVLPLWGALQFSDNQDVWAGVTSVLFVLLLLAALNYFFNRIRTYRPKTEDVTIELE